jgi:succinate dehydrogenase flavin-adding protein (antitoxin of CptAB toxin-antitoxin module)
MGADNQQERLDALWITGFTDGEGCFHVSINKISKMSLGWQVLPEFRIVQHEKDSLILHKIKNYFGFGEVRINRKDKNGTRLDYRVRGIDNLNKIIEFFNENPLKTLKQNDFLKFKEIISLMNERKHLTKGGLDKIAKLISVMNRKPNPKYLESSETICQK